MKSRKVVRPARHDPDNSVDLFDANRENEFGEPYCVAAAILESEVEQYWDRYLKFPDAILQDFSN